MLNKLNCIQLSIKIERNGTSKIHWGILSPPPQSVLFATDVVTLIKEKEKCIMWFGVCVCKSTIECCVCVFVCVWFIFFYWKRAIENPHTRHSKFWFNAFFQEENKHGKIVKWNIYLVQIANSVLWFNVRMCVCMLEKHPRKKIENHFFYICTILLWSSSPHVQNDYLLFDFSSQLRMVVIFNVFNINV